MTSAAVAAGRRVPARRRAVNRTRVARLFPNEAACLQLFTALAMETRDDCEAGKVYLTLAD